MKINEIVNEGNKKPGLWANINAKRNRIKSGSGERMRKPGSKGAPTAKDFKDAASESMLEDLPPPENARKTQIAGTLPTYKKAAEILKKTGVQGNSLDFGAGLGLGTSELGPDAHSYEPFPNEKFKPHFVDVTKIPDNSYKKIVNLNVLNVVPNTGEHKIRDTIVRNIGRVLAPGGVALITTRGKDVLTIKGTPGEEPTSMISKIGTYQKGFTQTELKQYIQSVLGDGFEVSSIKLGPAGVMIKKLDQKDVAEADNSFNRMMNKVTSPKSIDMREALAMMMDLIYHGGASYKEALNQASTSFEIDPVELQSAYQEHSRRVGSEDLAESAGDTVSFEVDSENAYNRVMRKFGSVIDWDDDTMVAPRKFWGAIQELAYSAGGEAIEVGDEQHVEEASPMIKPPSNRFDTKQEAFANAKKHGGKVFKSTYIDPNTGNKSICFVVKKEQGVAEGILEETYHDDDEFFEAYGVMEYNDEMINEAEYQGRKVTLNKPMQGDVKKFKVYTKNEKGNVVKVNFGQKGAKIKKNNPGRRKNFRARHNCDNPGPKTGARYWSCRKW